MARPSSHPPTPSAGNQADERLESVNRPHPTPRLQFGLSSFLRTFTVIAAVSAPLAYLGRAMRGERGAHFVFILLCLAAPTLALVFISLINSLFERRRP